MHKLLTLFICETLVKYNLNKKTKSYDKYYKNKVFLRKKMYNKYFEK